MEEGRWYNTPQSYKVKITPLIKWSHVAYHRTMPPLNSYTPVIFFPRATIKPKVKSDRQRLWLASSMRHIWDPNNEPPMPFEGRKPQRGRINGRIMVSRPDIWWDDAIKVMDDDEVSRLVEDIHQLLAYATIRGGCHWRTNVENLVLMPRTFPPRRLLQVGHDIRPPRQLVR